MMRVRQKVALNSLKIVYGGGSLVVPIASAGARGLGIIIFVSNFALRLVKLGLKSWKIV